VRQWREGVEGRLAAAGERLRVLNGHGRFTGEREIEVAGTRYRGEIVVINTGVRPAAPDVEGLAALPWLDNRRIMELTELPGHLIVLGGGYIGCAFEQMFRRCGSAGNVALDAKWFVKVDDQYRTSAKGVYAVGDVTGGPQFTHTSWDDHRILFDLLMGGSARSRCGRVIPSVVFTDPQVASVGLNERE